MVARYTGACLGLLAFAVVIVSGAVVHNSPMVTLSRALWAMVLFCILGLVLGTAAQAVVKEHLRRREEAVLGSLTGDKSSVAGAEQSQPGEPAEPSPTAGAEGLEA